MEASLFRRAKLEAARQGRPLSALLEDALERYFAAGPRAAEAKHSTVDDLWGAMAVPPDVLREIMDSDDDDFYV